MNGKPNRWKRRTLLQSREFFDAGFPLYIMETEQRSMRRHAHDFYEMVYVRRGHGRHIISRDEYSIRAGDLFLIHPGETHRYAVDENATMRIVNVLWQPALVSEVLRASDSALPSSSLPYIEPFLNPQKKFAHRLHLSGSAAFRLEVLLDEMRREVEAAKLVKAPPGSHALLRHLFCSLLILLSRVGTEENADSPNSDRRNLSRAAQQSSVAQAIEYLETHYAQRIALAEVAGEVALSESRLAHLFKAQTGRSVMAYLQELRLERACALLKHESTLPVHQVASDCGFTDPRFFHRVFLRSYGCSPGAFRENTRA